jgi:hypothetical protein
MSLAATLRSTASLRLRRRTNGPRVLDPCAIPSACMAKLIAAMEARLVL